MCQVHVNHAAAVTSAFCYLCRPGSPLWNMSIDDLLLQEMEVMVFFEGIDAMTSNSVQVSIPTTALPCSKSTLAIVCRSESCRYRVLLACA